MNTSNPLAKPLQLPIFVVLLATAALIIAAVQWLASYMRISAYTRSPRPVSPEFAERFCMRGRIPHQS